MADEKEQGSGGYLKGLWTDTKAQNKVLNVLTEAQILTNENLLKIDASIKSQMSGVVDAVKEPPPTDVEAVKEGKTENKKFLDSMKGMLKSAGGGMVGAGGGLLEGVKKMMSKYKKIIMGLLGAGLVALLSQLDMKQLKGIWESLKNAFFAIKDFLTPIVKTIWEWATSIALPALVDGFMEQLGLIGNLFTSLKERFAGFMEMSWSERIMAILGAFGDIAKYVSDTIKNLLVTASKMLGGDGTFITDLWTKFENFFNGLIEWVKLLFEDPKKAFQQLWAGILEGGASIGDWLWKNGIKPVVDWFKETFTLDNVISAIKTGWEVISNVGKWLNENAIKPVINWFKETFTLDNVISAIKTGWEKISNIGKWLWDHAIKPMVTWLEDTLDIDIMGPLKEGWKVISNIGTWLWDHAIKPFVDWITGLFESDENKPDDGKSLWEKMFPKGIVSWLVDTIIDPFISGLKNLGEWVMEGLDIDWGQLVSDWTPDFVKKLPVIGKWFGGKEEKNKKEIKTDLETANKEATDLTSNALVDLGSTLKEFTETLKSFIFPTITPLSGSARGRGKGSELAQIKKDEGFRSGVYKDTAGIDTVGYGFNLEREGAKEALDKAGIKKSVADLRSGKVQLSEEEASQLMMGEMGHFRNVAKRFVGEGVWKSLSSNRQGIITNMAYNMGEGTLSKFKKLQAAIRSGDWKEAQSQMKDSNWAKQTKGRADRLIARMGQNDSGQQIAAGSANLNAGSAGGGGTNVVNNTTNVGDSTTMGVNSADARNNQVKQSHVETATG